MSKQLPVVKMTFENAAVDDTGPWQVLRIVELEEEISKPYRCVAELAPVTLGAAPVTDPFLGDTCVLTIERDEPDFALHHLGGVITRVVAVGTTLNKHVIEVHIVPALWALSQRRDTRIFQ